MATIQATIQHKNSFVASMTLILHNFPSTMPTSILRLWVTIMLGIHIFLTFSLTSIFWRISSVMREFSRIFIVKRELRKVFGSFPNINPCDSLHKLMGFTTFTFSTLAASLHENTMTSFDTDSSFWVCDNSATGHICNDRTLFTGDLVPSIYIVGAATGTSEPTLMGTVDL